MENETLLDLYIKSKNDLLVSLEHLQPTEASNKISRFLRELERPYTDSVKLNKEQSRVAHYTLGVAAEASKAIEAVTANPNLTKVTEITQSKPNETSQLLSNTVKPAIRFVEDIADPLAKIQKSISKKIKSAVGGVRRMAGFFLLAIVAMCIGSVVAIFYVPSSLVPIIALVIIAIVATAGATATFVSKPSTVSLSLSELQSQSSLPSIEDIKVNYSFDLNVVDSKIRNSLRIADELLGLFASKPVPPKEDSVFNPNDVLELLQLLVAYEITGKFGKSNEALSIYAISLLDTVGIKAKEYGDETAHLFKQQPAGIPEKRTLLPALINEKDDIIRQGVVLIPVK